MIYLWIALLLLPQVVWGEVCMSALPDDPHDPYIVCGDKVIDTSKWTFPAESYYEMHSSVTCDSSCEASSMFVWGMDPCSRGWQYNKQTRGCERISGYCPVCGEKGVGTGVRIYHKGLTFACPNCHLLFWD